MIDVIRQKMQIFLHLDKTNKDVVTLQTKLAEIDANCDMNSKALVTIAVSQAELFNDFESFIIAASIDNKIPRLGKKQDKEFLN